MGPLLYHFIHFLGNQLQDQPLFQGNKMTGGPLEKTSRNILRQPPPKGSKSSRNTLILTPPPKKRGKNSRNNPLLTPPPIIQGTDHAIDIYIYYNLIKTTKYSMFIYINILQVIKT